MQTILNASYKTVANNPSNGTDPRELQASAICQKQFLNFVEPAS